MPAHPKVSASTSTPAASTPAAPPPTLSASLSAGQLLLIFADLIHGATVVGVIGTDGSFTAPTAEQDAQLGAMVEGVLHAHGVQIPDKIDKVIQMLPLVLALLG